ncbi:hypothetical protein H4Q26_015408 [Puccinia striiformis f. sp. tritici PST-130]|nr:hypothetical protein H4Q26_015408 [Puccinia striiformis f. sp. tritici PST-130]
MSSNFYTRYKTQSQSNPSKERIVVSNDRRIQRFGSELARESGLRPTIDLDSIEYRMGIKNAIQRGDVDEAITKVNDLNPEILDQNPDLFFHLQQQRMIEYIRQGQITEALVFAQQELAPRGEENPIFLSELERTMALLAFDTSSSVGGENNPHAPPSPYPRVTTTCPTYPTCYGMMIWGESLLSNRAEFFQPELAELLNRNNPDSSTTTTNTPIAHGPPPVPAVAAVWE